MTRARDKQQTQAEAGRVMAARRPRKYPGGMTEEAFVSVERRVTRGIRTLCALPDREKGWLTVKVCWPFDAIYDWGDLIAQSENREFHEELKAERAARFEPDRFDLGDYLTALAWYCTLDEQDRRIVWRVAWNWSFNSIAWMMGCSYDTAEKRYEEALKQCWRAARSRGDI